MSQRQIHNITSTLLSSSVVHMSPIEQIGKVAFNVTRDIPQFSNVAFFTMEKGQWD
mgnify:FL=1